jgi:hypothetical protein
MSGEGEGRGPGSEPSGHRTSRWRDVEWWLGRTDAQRARRERASQDFRAALSDLGTTSRELGRPDDGARAGSAASLGARISAVGKSLTIAVTMPIVALAFFGPVGLVVAIVLAVLLLAGRLGGARR